MTDAGVQADHAAADDHAPALVVVAGPTATGKSELSLDLAEALHARGESVEIVNGDAMQLYRGMDIGTAKLAPSERRGVPHHLIDVLEVTDRASVAAFQRDARAIIDDLRARGVRPMLVGGSGLYLSAVMYDLAFPPTDPRLRTELEQRHAEQGTAALLAELDALDPHAARAVDSANPRRVIRALEAVLVSGRPYRATLPERAAQRIPTRLLFLDGDREAVRERIERRAASMFAAGLVDETRALIERGLREGVTARQAIGYRQAIGVIDGVLTEPDAVADTARATARYARRQRSWFNRTTELVRLDRADRDLVAAALDAVDRWPRP